MKKSFTNFAAILRYAQGLADTFWLNASFLLGYWYAYGDFLQIFELPQLQLGLFVNAIWLLLLIVIRPYDVSRFSASITSGVYSRIFTVVGLHLLIIAAFQLIFRVEAYSIAQLVSSYLLLLLTLLAWKVLFVVSIKYLRIKGFNRKSLLVIGTGQLAKEIQLFFEEHKELGYRLYQYPDKGKGTVTEEDLDSIRHYVKYYNIEEVYCCLTDVDASLLQKVIQIGEENLLKIKLVSDFRGFADKGVELEYLDYIPVLNVSDSPFEDLKMRYIKRTFDVVFSCSALLFLAPLLAIVAIITKLTSKGPVIFAQERIGRAGKPFMIYKFRSMYTDAEKFGPQLSKDNDPRITPWGRWMRKTRIDELPQFFNVLIGDMSVVGPRPERECYIKEIMKLAPRYRRLQMVKPGITSIGQVMFGYAENVEEMVKRLRYDVLYLRNISLVLDIKLVLLTVRVMVQGKGK